MEVEKKCNRSLLKINKLTYFFVTLLCPQFDDGYSWHRAIVQSVPDFQWTDWKQCSLDVFLPDWGQKRQLANLSKNMIFVDDVISLAHRRVPPLAKLITVQGIEQFHLKVHFLCRSCNVDLLGTFASNGPG